MSKKVDIGFFQEQQPNGLIANSLMRGMIIIPLIFGAVYLAFSIQAYWNESNQLLHYLQLKIITSESYLAMRAQLKIVDWIVLGSLISLSLGGKIIQKGVEAKSLNDEIKETPVEVKIIKAQSEADPLLIKAKADYLAKFNVACPEGKTIDEINNAINTNTMFV